MIWDLKTLERVRGLRSRRDVDEALLFKGGPVSVIAGARRELARELIAMGEPYGAIIHPGDLAFHESKSPSVPFTVSVECQWWPESDAVRIVGGPLDGQEWYLPNNKFEPFHYLPPPTEPAHSAAGGERIARVDSRIRTMTVCGWSEESRRLLYAAEGRT